MGFQDRDYYRERGPAPSVLSQNSMVVNLIIVNVVVYLVDVLTGRGGLFNSYHWISDHLSMHVGSLTQPWMWWQSLTAGFLHDPDSYMHIAINMLVLWMFGRDVEARLGKWEFLKLYLVMIIFASFCWAIYGKLRGYPDQMACLGASGAVTGVLTLFTFYYPQRTLLMFFVLPMPAWLAGVLMLVVEASGAYYGESNVAHSAHLGGAAFAAAYHLLHWNFHWLRLPWSGGFSLRSRRGLKIHRPKEEDPGPMSPGIEQEADRILEKLYQQGEASLTAREREILEQYSRRVRQKRS